MPVYQNLSQGQFLKKKKKISGYNNYSRWLLLKLMGQSNANWKVNK